MIVPIFNSYSQVRSRLDLASSSHCFTTQLALVLVRFDHVASFIVNANHGIV